MSNIWLSWHSCIRHPIKKPIPNGAIAAMVQESLQNGCISIAPYNIDRKLFGVRLISWIYLTPLSNQLWVGRTRFQDFVQGRHIGRPVPITLTRTSQNFQCQAYKNSALTLEVENVILWGNLDFQDFFKMQDIKWSQRCLLNVQFLRINLLRHRAAYFQIAYTLDCVAWMC